MSTPETTCTCVTCGYQWERGQNGDHSCAKFLQTRLDYLYTIAASAVIVWGNPEAPSQALDMSMQSLKRACESETGARMGCTEITPDANTLVMQEMATLIKETVGSHKQERDSHSQG